MVKVEKMNFVLEFRFIFDMMNKFKVGDLGLFFVIKLENVNFNIGINRFGIGNVGFNVNYVIS